MLGQSLTVARVAGSLALAAGLAIIAQAGLARGRGIALAFAALTGISIAVYSVIDAGAVRSAGAVGYLGAVTVVQAVILLGAVGWTPSGCGPRPAPDADRGRLGRRVPAGPAGLPARPSPVATLRNCPSCWAS